MAEFASGNIFIREMRFENAGEVVIGHKHNFDHTTYVARGALRIEKLEPLRTKTTIGLRGEPIVEVVEWKSIKSVEKRAGEGFNWVLIKADTVHRITALEDGSIGHCIYSHRNPQGEIVQEYDGWLKGIS